MQLVKPVLVDLKMTTVVEAVNILFVSQPIKDGDLHASEAIVAKGIERTGAGMAEP